MIKGEGRGGGLRVAGDGGFLSRLVLDGRDDDDLLRETEAMSISRMDCNLPGLSPAGGLANECRFVGAVALLLVDEIVLRLEDEGKIEVDFDEEIGEGEVKRFRKD